MLLVKAQQDPPGVFSKCSSEDLETKGGMEKEGRSFSLFPWFLALETYKETLTVSLSVHVKSVCLCVGSGKHLCTEKETFFFLFSSSFLPLFHVSLLPLVTFGFDPKTCSYKQEEGTMTQWSLCYANALSHTHTHTCRVTLTCLSQVLKCIFLVLNMANRKCHCHFQAVDLWYFSQGLESFHIYHLQPQIKWHLQLKLEN